MSEPIFKLSLMAFGAMAFDCNRIFRLNVLSPWCILFVFGLLLRCTVDIPAVVAAECVGLFRPENQLKYILLIKTMGKKSYVLP